MHLFNRNTKYLHIYSLCIENHHIEPASNSKALKSAFFTFRLLYSMLQAWTNNYMDTNAKCRHLKKLTSKGTLRQVFIKVYRLLVMLEFSTQLSPLPCIFRQCVAGRGVGVLSSVGDHILQEFKTLYLTRFRTYKIARPPQTKT
jgi:hypothetical protein